MNELTVIDNQDIVNRPLSKHKMYELLDEKRSDIRCLYNRITEKQKSRLRLKLNSLSNDELNRINNSTHELSKLALDITKDYHRQRSVIRIMHETFEFRMLQINIEEIESKSRNIKLVHSNISESDIIRARLKAFGNSLRSKYSDDENAEYNRRLVRRTKNIW